MVSWNDISYLNKSGCVLGGVTWFQLTYTLVLVSGSAVKTTGSGTPSVQMRERERERERERYVCIVCKHSVTRSRKVGVGNI